MREMDANESDVLPIDEGCVEIAMGIGDLFGRRWKWPIVLGCLALKPWHALESQIMRVIQQPKFSDVKGLVVSPQEMKVSASANLPEVMRMYEIMRTIHRNLSLDEAHCKSFYRDKGSTYTETTAPAPKYGHNLLGASFATPVFC
ncbi:hypothetical protein LTR56_026444 [Elasticomyces elasticus]|nr:hypothetical protein LTR56_026444 [Elasticomyces elasticus]